MQDFLDNVRLRTPGEDEFHQAVQEFVESIWDFYIQNPQYQKAAILERMTEPERSVIFRVPWVDDSGKVHVNRGYRVQFNSAIGPYKGGIRFHPNVTLSTLKFLGFEQTFRTVLLHFLWVVARVVPTSIRGKSDMEIMRFCQSMAEMFRHIGPDTDIPAGDIGVGQRSKLFVCMYKNKRFGVLTGKGRDAG